MANGTPQVISRLGVRVAANGFYSIAAESFILANSEASIILTFCKCGKIRITSLMLCERAIICHLDTTNQVPVIRIGMNGASA